MKEEDIMPQLFKIMYANSEVVKNITAIHVDSSRTDLLHIGKTPEVAPFEATCPTFRIPTNVTDVRSIEIIFTDTIYKTLHWKVYLYSYGWFYYTLQKTGIDYINVGKNDSIEVFLNIGKIVHVPKIGIYKQVLPEYVDDCNDSKGYSFDEKINKEAHNLYYNHNQTRCLVPFYEGDELLEGRPQCSKYSQYNKSRMNAMFRYAMTNIMKPCNQTTLLYGPIHR